MKSYWRAFNRYRKNGQHIFLKNPTRAPNSILTGFTTTNLAIWNISLNNNVRWPVTAAKLI